MSDGQIAASAGTGQPSPRFQPVAGGPTRIERVKRAVAGAIQRFNAGPANDNGPGSQFDLTNEVDRMIRPSGGPADLTQGASAHEFSNLVGGPHYLKDGEPESGSPPSSSNPHEFSNIKGGPQTIARITPESGDGQGS